MVFKLYIGSEAFKELYNLIFEISKAIITKVAKALLITVAAVYGASEALVDFAGSALGISMSSYGAIGYLKMALSISLAALVLYQVAKYSYFALAGLFGATQAIRLLPSHQNIEEEPAPLMKAKPFVEIEHPNVLTTQFNNVNNAQTNTGIENAVEALPQKSFYRKAS